MPRENIVLVVPLQHFAVLNEIRNKLVRRKEERVQVGRARLNRRIILSPIRHAVESVHGHNVQRIRNAAREENSRQVIHLMLNEACFDAVEFFLVEEFSVFVIPRHYDFVRALDVVHQKGTRSARLPAPARLVFENFFDLGVDPDRAVGQNEDGDVPPDLRRRHRRVLVVAARVVELFQHSLEIGRFDVGERNFVVDAPQRLRGQLHDGELWGSAGLELGHLEFGC